ncbi:INO80 complex, subunit Ies4 [Astrocystis sublimbata]|nr:INO80 complex, subunit Ies4 [Astrocystis sublimbata]
MPANAKTSASNKEKDRRKSNSKSLATVTLKVPSSRLRKILDPSWTEEETPKKDSAASSPVALNDVPAVVTSQDDNASPSSPGTPAAGGTPSQTPMGPPTDNLKKKGVKRSAAAANNDPTAKIRGKPGPKKKARLEDGTIDPNGRPGGSAYHKLGPKANQGAINAGLRALDRSGAPCRKWTKGGFRLKSFTGVLWEIPRWTAPSKPQPEAATDEAATSADSSNKENKDDSQMKSENSASNVGGEPQSIPPSVHVSSPAPVAVAAS